MERVRKEGRICEERRWMTVREGGRRSWRRAEGLTGASWKRRNWVESAFLSLDASEGGRTYPS